jgi:hypothetical protein
MHGFQPAEMYVGPPPKHDMILCRFALRQLLPMHGNLRRITFKRAMHLRLVAEITSGGMSRRQCHTNLFLSLTKVNCYESKAIWPKTWGRLLVHRVQCLIASALKLYVNSPSVSPPISTFSGIFKVMKFY